MQKTISVAFLAFAFGILGLWHTAHAQLAIANSMKLTGTWYDQRVGGQGFLIDVEYVGDGTSQNVYGGWFTFTLPSASGSSPMWLTFWGQLSTPSAPAPINIYYTTGGQFDALPATHATFAGFGTLQFTDCTHASLTYSLPGVILNSPSDPPSSISGTISLSRLTGDTGCAQAQYTPTTRGFSGAWYDPATSGQGFFLDVSGTAGGLLFGGWFTYGQNAVTDQAWYTLQGPFPEGATEADVTVYRGKDETFLTPLTPAGGIDQTQPVGTAHIKFSSCDDAQLTYFVEFPNTPPATRTISLKRLSPDTIDCLLAPLLTF